MTGLKPHEIRTLQLVAHGYTSRQIARRLNITERSAEQRIWRASRKLGATGPHPRRRIGHRRRLHHPTHTCQHHRSPTVTTCIAPTPSLAGYTIHGCRCPHCNDAHNHYQNNRTRQIAYGRWEPLVDAEPARQHIRALMAQGMGWMHTTRLAGLSPGTVSKILYGSRGRPAVRRIRPATAQAILNVHIDVRALADGAHINAVGTHRRIQALATIGWAVSEQARRLGRDENNHAQTLKHQRVTAGLAKQIIDLYEQLSHTPAPDSPAARRAITWARKRGWAPPLAWDDDTIDDTAAKPQLGGGPTCVDDVLVQRAIDGDTAALGRLNPAEKVEAARRLLARPGVGVGSLSRLLNVSGKTAHRLAEQAEAAA